MCKLQSEKGSMTIETAIVLPLLIFLVLSIISVGLYLHDYYVEDIQSDMGNMEEEHLLIEKGEYPMFIPGIADLKHKFKEQEHSSIIGKEVKKQWQVFYIFDVIYYYAERLKVVQALVDKKDNVIKAIKDIVR